MRVAERMAYKACNCEKRGFHKTAKLMIHLMRIVFSFEFKSTVHIGERVQFVHNGLGTVVHPKTVIGNNCKIYQNVTLGGNGKIVNGVTTKGAPVLEDNVAVFSGACVLGPITIGHDSIIGANAVITKDVPPNSLVFGNPAIVKELNFKYNFGDK